MIDRERISVHSDRHTHAVVLDHVLRCFQRQNADCGARQQPKSNILVGCGTQTAKGTDLLRRFKLLPSNGQRL